MAKRKLQRFAEIATFRNVFDLSYEASLAGFFLKGRWNSTHFKNENPIVLELGCGRGEYTVGLAQKFPHKNFIGIDIKGARLWRGAKTAEENQMNNVAFLRTRIDFITSCFAENEVSEIWITFPDPQPQKTRERKRLTSPRFLKRYLSVLLPEGTVHLKTDNYPLYAYTLDVIRENQLPLLGATDDLYGDQLIAEDTTGILSIQTAYESRFIGQGLKICYLRFRLSQ